MAIGKRTTFTPEQITYMLTPQSQRADATQSTRTPLNVTAPLSDHEKNLQALERAAMYAHMARIANPGQTFPDVASVYRPLIAGDVETQSSGADPQVAAAIAQLKRQGYTDFSVTQEAEQATVDDSDDEKKGLLSTRPRKIALSLGGLSLVLVAAVIPVSDENTPFVGRFFSASEAMFASDSNAQPEEVNGILNEEITKKLTILDARRIAEDPIGTPESEASSAKKLVTQPVDLTTDVGVLSGDTVGLNFINPAVQWMIKITEPKFTFTPTEGATTGKLAIDPTSIILMPIITSESSEWNTVTVGDGKLIDAELKKINPALTDAEIAAAKTKAVADLTASSAAVGQNASQKIISDLMSRPEYVQGLTDVVTQYFIQEIDTILKNENLRDYKILMTKSSFTVDTAQVLADYAAAIAANPAQPISPNVTIVKPVNGIQATKPTGI